MVLLIHAMNCIDCASCDFFLHLFKNNVHNHFIFPKINKRGLELKWGGWKISKNGYSGGWDDYPLLKSQIGKFDIHGDDALSCRL